MKKIGIDARLFSQTGVGTYLRNLIRELSLLRLQDIHFYLYVLPEDKSKIDLDSRYFTVREAPCKWHTLAEQTLFLTILRRDRLDLVHFTYFGYPVLYSGKYIATIHDLTPLLFKTGKASTKNPFFYHIKHFFFRHILDSQVKHAVSLITPTAAVKKQLIDRYGVDTGKKIHPIYEGVGYELMQGRENAALKNKYKQPFFIYVGNFYPHKNIANLVHAFAQAGTPARLVLVGPQDYFSSSVSNLIRSLKIEDRIEFFHNATVSDLIFFYKNAVALLHPSLSEGFGLPLVEAAYFNCPVVASDIPVIRELLGDKYIPFDPYSVSDMQDKISQFAGSPVTFNYRELIANYSFKSMAKSTVNLYKKFAG